jgi:hypothetical protein
MMKNRILLIFLCTVFLFTFIGLGSVYALEYLDGDLVIHGKASQQLALSTKSKRSYELYDYDIFNFRSTLKIETRWDAFKGSNYNLTFYSVFKNYYDAAHEIDSGFNNYMRQFSGKRGIDHELKTYDTFRDICRELYAEVTHPFWQIRLGKQIVSWGEASFARMADVVNPLDARGTLNPAYPDFDEIKRGLWMARLTITPPDFWQDIFFEFLVIPDFEPTRNWPMGYHLTKSPSANSLRAPNELFLSTYRDSNDPDEFDEWSDPAIGFRIRGLTYGFDWSFQYLYHRDPNGIIREGRGIASQLPALLGRGRAENVRRFGHQSTIGFTFNKPIDKQITLIPGTSTNMSGNVWRGEFVIELDKDNNRGFTPEVVEHNRYAFVLGWDTYIQIPWLSTWNRNRKLSSSTQLFMEWVPDRHRDDIIYPYYAPPTSYGEKRHHAATITQSLWYDFWNSRITPAIYFSHSIDDGRCFYAPTLSFKPTFNWTYMVRYINYIDYGNYIQNLDYVLFDITYEF